MSTLNVENIKHIAADSDSLRLATDGTVTFTKNVTADSATITTLNTTSGNINADSATITNLSGTNLSGTNLSGTNVTASGDIKGSSFNGGQLGGRRNLIINGGMQVSQRYGTNRTFVNAGSANTNAYSLDRWQPGQYQQAGHQQVSVTDSSVPTTKAVRVSSSSSTERESGTRMAFGQIVEHANCDFVAGRTVTLSFWIRFSSASITGSGDFAMQLSEYDTVDPDFGITGADRTNGLSSGNYISNGSFPTTWTKYTQTATCASTVKNIGARFLFADLFNTTNNGDEWYEVTAVQLELGDTATPFEHRSFAEELQLCERYFQKSYDHDTAIGANTNSGAVFSRLNFSATNRMDAGARFSTRLRATPTITIYSLVGTINNVSDIQGFTGHQSNVGVSAVRHAGETGIGGISLSTATDDGIGYHYTASAEL